MLKIKQIALFIIVLMLVTSTYAQKKDYTAYVNTLVGTQSKFELSNGNTYPAIAMPWGMNFWSPQTDKMGGGWLYSYTDDKIRGFKQTHQPSPWMNDYGQFSIMPVTGQAVFNEDERASWFSHKAEVAKPHYYSVYLADHDVTTEITPTERSAMFRFTFPNTENAYVIVDAFDRGSYVKIIPSQNKIVGYTTRNSGGVPDNFKNYFVVQFDKPFTYSSVSINDSIYENAIEAKENHVGAIIGFTTKQGEQVHAKVSSSFISAAQAEINLKELGNNSFNHLVEQGKDIWNKTLGHIDVEDDNIDNLRTFYSCLYRSVLFPRRFHEIDEQGNIRHYSPYNGKILPGYMFVDTGFWDTFRSLYPFLNLMYPSINEKMQEGLVNAYKESGFLPEWSSPGHRNIMVGNNSASVVADAYLKGIKGYDIGTLYEALLHGANNHLQNTSSGRVGYDYYNKLGYIPNDVNIGESAARTLEYAYNDWTIYKLGKALNRPSSETDLYAKRAMNYKNLFHNSFNLMSGRDSKGEFPEDFEPEKWWGPFTEGNSWHYSWSVFHDPQGLIDMMGGDKTFTAMLDSVFSSPPTFGRGVSTRGNFIHEMREMQVIEMGQYAHGNQPIQHMTYLYNYGREPWKTQYWVREAMDKLYRPTPDGYCGDEDNGQTSAWYVCSALGFYTVCPGTDQYVLGSPIFKKVTLNLENGKKVIISSNSNNKNNRYISSMTINGKSYSKNYITHSQLINGLNINYEMSSIPNKKRGINDSDLPYSFTNELKK